MEDTKMIDVVERYIRGEMKPDERLAFENLRKSNQEVDLLVVEHTLFLQQMNRFGEIRNFKSTLHEVHIDLAEQGKIESARLKGTAKVVYIWKRYKRVTAIAASIAGITTLTISALVWALTPQGNNQTEELSLKFNKIQGELRVQKAEVNNLKNKISAKPIAYKSGGTSFLIDGKGYLVTNAHIIRNSKNVVVINNKGEEFATTVVKVIPEKDIALLKIADETFKPIPSLPYGIRKSSTDVAEPIFTLGYPRNDIVYSEGYLSAKTGKNGDTITCQLGIAANHGNSGGPVFNHDGEIIGIVSTRDTEAEGVAFAIQSKYIFDAVDELKKDTVYQSLRLPVKSTVKGLGQTQQVKKIQDYIFMVKAD